MAVFTENVDVGFLDTWECTHFLLQMGSFFSINLTICNSTCLADLVGNI